MSRIRISTGMIGVIALGLVALGFTPPVFGTDAIDRDVAYATSFRADYGFQNGEPFVRSTYDDVHYSNTEWGLPLSSAEATELHERLVVRANFQVAVDYAEEQPD